MRFFLLLPLAACAGLPEIRPCDPTGAVIEPSFVNIGNSDLMIASMRFRGCADYDFQLCGIGDPWLTAQGARLGVWHDETLGECGNDEQLEDVLFNLASLRHRYEKDYKVKTATLVLEFGSVTLPYSFFEER